MEHVTVGSRLVFLFVGLLAGGAACLLGWALWPAGLADAPAESMTVWALVQAFVSAVSWGVGLWIFVQLEFA